MKIIWSPLKHRAAQIYDRLRRVHVYRSQLYQLIIDYVSKLESIRRGDVLASDDAKIGDAVALNDTIIDGLALNGTIFDSAAFNDTIDNSKALNDTTIEAWLNNYTAIDAGPSDDTGVEIETAERDLEFDRRMEAAASVACEWLQVINPAFTRVTRRALMNWFEWTIAMSSMSKIYFSLPF